MDFLRKMLLATFIALLCNSCKVFAFDPQACAWLATISASANTVHRQYDLPRENYHVAWTDDDAAWIKFGEAALDAAFEWTGDPHELALRIYHACVGVKT